MTSDSEVHSDVVAEGTAVAPVVAAKKRLQRRLFRLNG